jgi:transposase
VGLRPGRVKAFGIEGTGSYGAGLSRDLIAKGHTVLDVMRPIRQLRYLHGKSDSLDVESAARSVLNGQATARAKTQAGSSEMIRHLKIARDSAVKAKSQAMITLKTLIINAPANLRDSLDQGENCFDPTCCSTETWRYYITHRVGQGIDASDCTPLAGVARGNSGP